MAYGQIDEIEPAKTLDELEDMIRRRGWGEHIFHELIKQPVVETLVGDIARRYCYRVHYCWEALRDTILSDLWVELPKYNFPPPPGYTFAQHFCGFVCNCYHRFARGEKRHARLTLTDSVEFESVAEECHLDSIEALVRDAAQGMTGIKGDIVRMILDTDVPQKEIAEIFDVSEGYVSQVKKEFLKKARSLVELIDE